MNAYINHEFNGLLQIGTGMMMEIGKHALEVGLDYTAFLVPTYFMLNPLYQSNYSFRCERGQDEVKLNAISLNITYFF